MDSKTWTIVILILVVAGLGSYIGVSRYQQKLLAEKQLIYDQGINDGRLVEQRNVILQLQNSGFYSLSFYDENNQTQTIRLGLIQQQLQQGQQSEQTSSNGLVGR